MEYQQKILEHFRSALPDVTDLTEAQAGWELHLVIGDGIDQLGIHGNPERLEQETTAKVRILLNHLGIKLSEEPGAQNILAALQWCRDISIDEAQAAWDEALRKRCPLWWQKWALKEQRCERRLARIAKHLQRPPEELMEAPAAPAGPAGPADCKATKVEVLELLTNLSASLEKHHSVLATCRRESTVKLSLTEDFQWMPPRAMQLIGTVVEEEVVAKGFDLHSFWSSAAPHLGDPELSKALLRLRRALEGEAPKAPRANQLAVQGRGQLAACGSKLTAGMRVMLKWQPGSVGAIHLAYLNGQLGVARHVGVLNSWDSSSQRWQVGFESFDGHLDVSAENLQLCNEKHSSAPKEQLCCEMCLGRFLESQLTTLPCPDEHGYCQSLDDLCVLTLAQGATEPWCAVVTGEAEANSAYRITKEDVDQLQCICCFQELDLGCLVVDDCLSSGRQARGETCPSKSERLGLGLSVASLGCACVVKQAMDEMFVEQLAMPFDWLVSRVEGIIYFFRHGFRDFSYYDDVKEAFQRRGERLLEMVRSTRSGARPLLLIRVCARSEELDHSEELYQTLKLLGCLVPFGVDDFGSSDLVDAVRFGMDYVYAAASFGRHAVEDAAPRVSAASPVPEAAALRVMLKPHRSESSPYYSQELEKLVKETSSAMEIVDFLNARTRGVDVNAWSSTGETVLFAAARRGQVPLLAALLVAAADPNCRAKDGRRALDHVPPEGRLTKAAMGSNGNPWGPVGLRTREVLLRSAAGDVHMTESWQALEAVPEPLRRQLCGLLGLFATPELWAPAGGRDGATPQGADQGRDQTGEPWSHRSGCRGRADFVGAAQAEACGAVDALRELQRGAARALEAPGGKGSDGEMEMSLGRWMVA
eukprot:Skav205687  [mRNA]  locus=scaffold2655:74023:94641:- [translate_table: standard]